MDNWVSHTLTGVLCGLAGFILRFRQQTSEEWKSIAASLRERVAVLESRIEDLHKEIAQGAAVEAELREKIATLLSKIAHLETKGAQ
jgi:hypothetical protein